MRQFGLIGYPLGHSFSATYFGQKFKEEGIDATYTNFPLARMADLELLLEKEPGVAGLNVTVPYKQEIIPYIDSLSATASEIQAVNTITFRRDQGRLILEGDNTDVIGFRRSLEDHLKPHHTSALVLGTGGSSKAVLYVLGQLGIGYTMVSRSAGVISAGKSLTDQQQKGRRITYCDLTAELVAQTPLIINTTPLGMHPRVDTFPDIPYKALTSHHLLFDLVYNPKRTEFLTRGEKLGAAVVNGYDMLIFQAEASWEIWNR
jgi:shikimate dehydrogenase